LTIPHYLVAPVIAANTDLIITLPSHVANHYAEAQHLRMFPPPVALKGFDVVMAFHARSVADPPIEWLKQPLRVVAADIDKVEGTKGRLGGRLPKPR
jgi:DNA-binding transcriptional LysR family regulator